MKPYFVRPGKRWLSILAAMLLTVPLARTAQSAQAQPSPAVAAIAGPSDPAEVEAFADAFFAQPEIKDNLAGAAFTVVGGDRMLLNKGYGYADAAKKTPVNPDTTVFRVASISKLFTATAVMQLAEDGALDLNANVEKYMGGAVIPNRTGEPVTMKHLLTHTTGFDYTDLPELQSDDVSLQYPLDSFIRNNMPTVVRKPGESYKYDNFAFNLQGYIVQQIAGKPFAEVVRERIFEPLGMRHSDFLATGEVLANLATAYGPDRQPIPPYPNVPTASPDGGMFATGGDMAKFMLAHLNDGKLGEAVILEADTAREMHRTQVASNPKQPNMAYGFEMFFQEYYNGQVVIGKGGDMAGYHSWLWLLPERKVGGFIVTNSDALDVRVPLFKAFMDHYYPKPADPAAGTAAVPNAQLARLEGTYRNLRIPMVLYEVKSDAASVTLTGPDGPHPLKAVEPTLFRDGDGRLAAFKTEEADGNVYLDYNFPGSWFQKLPLYRDFEDVPAWHPHYEAVQRLRKLNALPNPAMTRFEPEKSVKRGEFTAWLIRMMGTKPSTNAPAWADTAGHSYAAEIQAAAEFGIVSGGSGDRFEPERPITRQEAALIAWRLAQSKQVPILPAKLAGDTAPWAAEAVEFVVGAKLYGPEIQSEPDGTINYRSSDLMLRQEAAELLSKFPYVVLGGRH